jgi:hypothetical protein
VRNLLDVQVTAFAEDLQHGQTRPGDTQAARAKKLFW